MVFNHLFPPEPQPGSLWHFSKSHRKLWWELTERQGLGAQGKWSCRHGCGGGYLTPRVSAHHKHPVIGNGEKFTLPSHHPIPAHMRIAFPNLHFTYEKFSPFADTFKKRVSKNTFFVLVRVVDELW